MTDAMRELEVLIARASIPEIARAVSLEGWYQASGSQALRETWYGDEVLGWRSCLFCPSRRPAKTIHHCQVLDLSRRRLTTGDV